MSSQADAWSQLMAMRQRAEKAKMKVMSDDSQKLDPLTKYAWVKNGEMPTWLPRARFAAYILFADFAEPPVERLGMLIAAELIVFWETLMAGYNAVPDAFTDVEGGYDLLVTEGENDGYSIYG